jgi:hypothetical protein
LQDLFGTVTQATPLYLQDSKRPNQPIRSLNADRLKSNGRICEVCNTARTQEHDKAWTTLSRALRDRLPQMKPGQFVRGNRVFPYETRRQLLAMHLYFVKVFGCHIAEFNAPIDLKPFGSAILTGKAHPNVKLKFGFAAPFGNEPHVGMTSIELAQRPDGVVTFAAWFHGVGILSVLVMFAEPDEHRQGLVDAWHPSMGNRLRIADFRGSQPSNEVA